MADEIFQDITLQPGESQLVSQPTIFRTILGSCVGITFRHSGLGIGAMCHPMLPARPSGSAAADASRPNTRFVDFAIHDMACRLDSLGALRRDVEVKLFGGGDVLPVIRSATRPTVGRLNCEAALQILEEEGFAIAASSLGGTRGVMIQFNTKTGEILLRRLG